MIEFFRSNSSVIPFAVCAACNLWVGLDVLFNKKQLPLSLAFFCWAGASMAMCWHYLVLRPGNE